MESTKGFLCSCIHIVFPAQPFFVEAMCHILVRTAIICPYYSRLKALASASKQL